MDAATAALLGATIGLSGTLVAPIVTSYQAKHTKGQELMREAYARGFACLAKIPRCTTHEDHIKLREKMLDALAHIEIVGTKKTSTLYSDVAESYEDWKINGGTNASFESSAKEFQESVRRDIDTTDTLTLSTPMIIVRLVAPAVLLPVYWWARFPALLHPAAGVLGGLETGIALAASLAGSCFVADAVIRLFKFMRKA